MGIINHAITNHMSGVELSNTYVQVYEIHIFKNRFPPDPESTDDIFYKYNIEVIYCEHLNKDASVEGKYPISSPRNKFAFNTHTLDNIEQQMYQGLKNAFYPNSADDI